MHTPCTTPLGPISGFPTMDHVSYLVAYSKQCYTRYVALLVIGLATSRTAQACTLAQRRLPAHEPESCFRHTDL